MNTLKQFMIALLGLIAAAVFCGLMLKVNMWALICLYWAVLLAKNIMDLYDNLKG